MSDFDEVIRRIETDFDFSLAVHNDPRQALEPYDLSDQERAALGEPAKFRLWALVAQRRQRALGIDVAPENGGVLPSGVVLPPPPPPQHAPPVLPPPHGGHPHPPPHGGHPHPPPAQDHPHPPPHGGHPHPHGHIDEDWDWDPASLLDNDEIQRTIGQLREAKDPADRLAAAETLMEQIE